MACSSLQCLPGHIQIFPRLLWVYKGLWGLTVQDIILPQIVLSIPPPKSPEAS